MVNYICALFYKPKSVHSLLFAVRLQIWRIVLLRDPVHVLAICLDLAISGLQSLTNRCYTADIIISKIEYRAKTLKLDF